MITIGPFQVSDHCFNRYRERIDSGDNWFESMFLNMAIASRKTATKFCKRHGIRVRRNTIANDQGIAFVVCNNVLVTCYKLSQKK